VKIIPSGPNFISHYEYSINGMDAMKFAVNDVIHFRYPNPTDDFYGQGPLQVISGRTDVDNFMKDFVKSYFQNSGIPGGLLNVKQTMKPEAKAEIARQFRTNYGGPSGWHSLMVIDNSEATFTPMTQALGTRGLVLPELDEIAEARIPMVFGVPQSLIGTRTSYQNGGYANKRAELTDFWVGTLAPLYKENAGWLKLFLMPEFPNVQDVAFDMSDVKALQEDADKVAIRWSNLAQKGVASLQEARLGVGLPAEWDKNAVFLVPSSSAPMQGDDLEEPVIESPVAPQLPAGRRGRPPIEDDEDAKALWAKGAAWKIANPSITNGQLASYMGVSEPTFYRWQAAFE
jgi:phage portal protein BeeE